jgi:hypothetical protein
MRASSSDDCLLFQQDLDLGPSTGLVSRDENAGKCKSISFSCGSKPVLFQYVIGDSDLERVKLINDLGLLVDSRMTFVSHIESIVSKSARMLGFIKRISREFNHPKTRCWMWLLLGQVWSMHRLQSVLQASFLGSKV